jgi:phosphoribosylformimino-5-aminoimidazole carboxamide ribotide isomerase
MQVLPVLDLLNGIVVRGVAGRRAEYRPLQTLLTTSVQPLDVARALRAAFDFSTFYVADLDAILHHRPNWDAYRRLIDDGFRLLVDAGIETVDESLSVRDCGAEPIVGLESCPGPRVLAEICSANDGAITFSLDLLNGRPLLTDNQSADNATGWNPDPCEIVRQSVEAGVTRIIVLDLADVGTSSGGRTDELCRSLRAEFPGLRLTCGGGVRGIEDLRRLKSAGADSVLVASALHDGRLRAVDLRAARVL